MGEYGLRNKRELWRVQMALSKMRNAARNLLTEDEGSTRRLFEGERGGVYLVTQRESPSYEDEDSLKRLSEGVLARMLAAGGRLP